MVKLKMIRIGLLLESYSNCFYYKNQYKNNGLSAVDLGDDEDEIMQIDESVSSSTPLPSRRTFDTTQGQIEILEFSKFSFSSLNCHFSWKITKMITRFRERSCTKDMMSLNSTLEMINLGASQNSAEIEAELMADIQEALTPGAKIQTDVSIVVADQKFKPAGGQDNTDLDDRIVQIHFAELQERLAKFSDSDIPFGKSGLTASAVMYKVI